MKKSHIAATSNRFFSIFLLSICIVASAGCGVNTMLSGPGGELTIRNQVGDSKGITTGFDRACYSLGDAKQMTMVLFDGDFDNPTRAMTVRMLWQPRAALTPIDQTATNATIHYIVFDHGDRPASDDADEDRALQQPTTTGLPVAVYSGAGFVYPYNEPGSSRVEIGVWEASLHLKDATKNYNDTLSPALVQGRFTVQRDEQAIQSNLRKLNVTIRERLGYPRLVESR